MLPPVRLLVVSDLHFDLRKLDAVLEQASDVDVVVIAGDLLDIGSALPLDAQITVVLTYLERLVALAPTIICSGNHDLDARAPSGEKVTRWFTEAKALGVHVDGDSLDRDGWRLTSCAWWEGPVTLGELESSLGQAAVDRPGRWLWVFHGPPEGPLSWTGSRHYGDPELPRLLGEHAPDIVLCGHIHQAPFTDEGSWVERRGPTWLFNGGHQPGALPTSIVLDLQEDRASWWSLAGEGTVDLVAQ